jgi:hypothetical protein
LCHFLAALLLDPLISLRPSSIDSAGGRESLTHLCYVAATVDPGEATRFHDKAMTQWGRGLSASDDSATGLLLAQEGFQLHYVEAPAATAIALLRSMQRQAKARPTFGAVSSPSPECYIAAATTRPLMLPH